MTTGESIATHAFNTVDAIGSSGVVQEGVVFENPIDPQEIKRNRFLDADKYVNKRRNDVALIPITYLQNGESIDICATPLHTIFKYSEFHQISIRKESRDFIVNVSDLVFGGVDVIPKDGDFIIEETLKERFTYEVGAFNQEVHYKYSGAYRQAFRIHTKRVKKEDI